MTYATKTAESSKKESNHNPFSKTKVGAAAFWYSDKYERYTAPTYESSHFWGNMSRYSNMRTEVDLRAVAILTSTNLRNIEVIYQPQISNRMVGIAKSTNSFVATTDAAEAIDRLGEGDRRIAADLLEIVAVASKSKSGTKNKDVVSEVAFTIKTKICGERNEYNRLHAFSIGIDFIMKRYEQAWDRAENIVKYAKVIRNAGMVDDYGALDERVIESVVKIVAATGDVHSTAEALKSINLYEGSKTDYSVFLEQMVDLTHSSKIISKIAEEMSRMRFSGGRSQQRFLESLRHLSFRRRTEEEVIMEIDAQRQKINQQTRK